MDPLSVAASIVALVQLTGELISFFHSVKDAPKECRQCTIEASNLLSLLTNLRYRLEDATNDDPWYTALRALNVENGPLDQYKQALEQLLSKVTIQDGLSKIRKQLQWKFDKAEVTDILQRMERLKSLVAIALENDHFKLTKAIKDDITVVRDTIAPMQTDLATVRDVQDLQWDAQKHQKHQAMMQWLSPSDFAAQQLDIISRKEEGTGQWFIDSGEFNAWQQGPDRTLFCPGIPGAGKTMIAAIAIDHLCKRARYEDLGVAYLFCNYKAQAEQTYAALLATSLRQLVSSRPDIVGPVTEMYERNTRPTLDEIFNALQSVCSVYSRAYFVVDALDECTDRDNTRTRLIDKFRNLQTKLNVHLMFTSRFIPEIVDKFHSDLVLEVRASGHDVRRYVAGQLTRLPKCIQSNSELSDNVQDRIAEAVNGMFLLARLYVDSLLDKKTIKKVNVALQKLKKGSDQLDSAYNEAIQRIEEQLTGNAELAKQALSWITYAERPLTIQELCHALAIEPGENELDPDAVYDIDDVLAVCAGLIAVDNESNVVRLVHHTTQEYLFKIREKWLPDARKYIATACITYLSMDAFLSGGCQTGDAFKARLQNHVFLGYTARYWAGHARMVQETVCELAIAFLRNKYLVSTTMQAAHVFIGPHIVWGLGYGEKTSGLHLIAGYGLTYIVRMLLEDLKCSEGVNARDHTGRTPLSLAAKAGHEAVVRLLLEQNNVEADSKNNDGITPVSDAARRGREAVVRLLIERDDVEANSTEKYGRTPLSYAAEAGYEAIVQLLLERDDVEVDLKDDFSRTPLSYAAEKGHEGVVRLLMERGNAKAI